MDSEPELERRYADLTMIIRPDMRHGKVFDVLIEFKFLSIKILGLSGEVLKKMPSKELRPLPQVEKTLGEGLRQGLDYGARLVRKYRELKLKTFVVTSLGFERICFVNADALEEKPG